MSLLLMFFFSCLLVWSNFQLIDFFFFWLSPGAFFYPKMFCTILSGTVLSDIEAGIGLKRKQLIAIALLACNDHDLHGVPGFEIDAAIRFVKLYSNDETLDPYV